MGVAGPEGYLWKETSEPHRPYWLELMECNLHSREARRGLARGREVQAEGMVCPGGGQAEHQAGQG